MEYSNNSQRVTICTVDGHTLSGMINLGHNERLSDLFTKEHKSFLVLYDATYEGGSGKVLFINKSHVIWAEPEEDALG